MLLSNQAKNSEFKEPGLQEFSSSFFQYIVVPEDKTVNYSVFYCLIFVERYTKFYIKEVENKCRLNKMSCALKEKEIKGKK